MSGRADLTRTRNYMPRCPQEAKTRIFNTRGADENEPNSPKTNLNGERKTARRGLRSRPGLVRGIGTRNFNDDFVFQRFEKGLFSYQCPFSKKGNTGKGKYPHGATAFKAMDVAAFAPRKKETLWKTLVGTARAIYPAAIPAST